MGQNNRNLKVAKIHQHSTIKQKSLSYPQKTNQNDPKGSLKYVKFTFVKFLTQKVYEIACFIQIFIYLLNNFDTGHKEENNSLTISHKTNIKQQIFWGWTIQNSAKFNCAILNKNFRLSTVLTPQYFMEKLNRGPLNLTSISTHRTCLTPELHNFAHIALLDNVK